MARALALLGILGGLFWMVLAFFPPIGPRETREYEILFNRLWTPALLAMLAGFCGFFTLLRPASKMATGGFRLLLLGLTLMVLGNFCEYWLLSDLPHQGPEGYKRGLAWMTFLLGVLLLLIASAVVGLGLLRSHYTPKWLALAFILLLPLMLTCGLMGANWAGIPLGILSMVVGGSGLLSKETRDSPT